MLKGNSRRRVWYFSVASLLAQTLRSGGLLRKSPPNTPENGGKLPAQSLRSQFALHASLRSALCTNRSCTLASGKLPAQSLRSRVRGGRENDLLVGCSRLVVVPKDDNRKVLVKLFQKLAGCRDGVPARSPQRAKHSGWFGGRSPLTS